MKYDFAAKRFNAAHGIMERFAQVSFWFYPRTGLLRARASRLRGNDVRLSGVS